jgi:large subunit ribosomal protein L13e
MSVKAIVKKKSDKLRSGRGFSREELKDAGIDFQKALKMRLPIDLRRKTKHQENVSALKEFLQKPH